MDENELIQAAKNGNHERAVSLLNGGYSVHLRDKDNATPLYWSSCRGFPEICRELIKRKSDVNAQVKWGSTALHAASDRNHLECVRLLIKCGANLDIQNSRGDTALHLSAYRGNLEIVKLLIRAHANVFIKNDKGKTPAGEAEGNNHMETAQVLHRRMKELTNRSKGDEEHQVLSCPESLGPILRDEIMRSKPSLVGKNSSDFVRYNSNLTDFRHQNNTTSGKSVNLEPEKKESQQIISNRGVSSNSQYGLKQRKYDPEAIVKRQSVNGTDFPANIRNGRLSPTESLDEPNLGQETNGYHEDPKKPVGETSPVFHNGTSVFDLSCSYSRRDPYSESQCETRSANAGTNENFAKMRQYAEMLQMNLVKSNDEVSKKDAEIKALKGTLENTQRQMIQYQYLCRKFYDEKVELENRIKQMDSDMLSLRNSVSQLSSESDRTNSVLLWSDYKDVQTFLKSVPQSTSDLPARALKDHVRTKWLPNFCNSCRRERMKETCETCESSLGHRFLRNSNKNSEWVVGSDYVLTNAKPVHQLEVNGRFESVCFDINHKGKPFTLKVVVSKRETHPRALLSQPGIKLNLNQPDIDLTEAEFQKTVDFKVITSCSHPNILSPLHHYTGSSDRFLKFFPSVAPDASVNPKSVPRAYFLVFNQYPYTLKSFFHEHGTALNQDFVYTVLYQILSAMDYLHRRGVSLRSMDPEKISLDRRLCPILRVTDLGVEEPSDPQSTMSSIHSTWNAIEKGVHMLGMTFNSLLHEEQMACDHPRDQKQPMGESHTHCRIHSAGLHFILQEMTRTEPSERITVQKALLYLGMLMFPPIREEIPNEEDARVHCQARLLTLLATKRREDLAEANFTQAQNVCWMKPQIEAHFLSCISAAEFWGAFQNLKQRNLFSV